MIQLDVAGIASHIVVDRVLVHRRYGIVIVGARRTLDLTRRSRRIVDVTVHAIRICPTEEDQLVGDFLSRGVRCRDRQIIKGIALRIVTVILDSCLSYQLIIDGADKAKPYRLGTASVVVLEVIPADGRYKIGCLLFPDRIDIKYPVACIGRNVRSIAALVIGQYRTIKHADRTRFLTIRSLPTDEMPTIGILQRAEQVEVIAVVVFLCGYKARALTCVVVIDLNRLARPFRIERLIAIYLGAGS